MAPSPIARVRPAVRSAPSRRVAAALAAPLWLTGADAALRAETTIPMDTRIEALEARLEALTKRVAALESAASATDPAGAPAAANAEGEPIWDFDGYVQGSPFRVLQRELNRETGRLDLLLDLVAEPPDSGPWTAAPGQEIPLALTLEPPGNARDQRVGPMALTLERGSRMVPGARIHVTARLDPALARSVRRIRIGQAPERTPDSPRCRTAPADYSDCNPGSSLPRKLHRTPP